MNRVLVILLVACGGEQAKPEPTPGSDKPTPVAIDAATAPPIDAAVATSAQPALLVTNNGKPVAIQSVVAVDAGEGQVYVELKSYPYTCKELTEGFSTRASEPTDFELKLRIGRYLPADGTLGWAIRGKYTVLRQGKDTTSWQQEKESGGDPLPPGTAIDPAAGTTFDLPLDFEMAKEKSDQAPATKYVVKGTAKVTACGDSKFKSKEPPPALQLATIEIAGQSLPIAGAGILVKKDGTRALELATHPVKCVDGSDYTSSRADVSLELGWDKAGKLYKIEREGYWVDWGINQAIKPGDPVLTATPNRPPPGAKEMTITLGGSSTVQGYPVALKGKVKAIVCPTPK